MDTRQNLIATAERLFAERGVDAVSMREINRAAGQGNASALHYHFGSRDALIEAIVGWRLQPVNMRRHEMLETYARDGCRGGADRLTQCLIRPMSEVASCRLEENGWLCFLGQLYAGSKLDLPAIAQRLGCDSSLHLLTKELRAAIPEVPRDVLDQRLAICVRQAVQALADWQGNVLQHKAGTRLCSLELFVENLVDMTAAALTAAPSTRTLKARSESGRISCLQMVG
ncbi:helix-turn-helix domain-containing protein [Roseomonas populi]|uniref:TetR/AcrR family transcriptional regulator n=1 Tax=Roseomonas populi TaxID=3121582 RepID=A0ABT1X6Z9_9PROT|nr:TetR/AcrR family transcriptional regulator [Roseomonas pecuniae]MCR0983888.1 TetR/AcrR family transcriptional regulator [Roseomonas pecuniae]